MHCSLHGRHHRIVARLLVQIGSLPHKTHSGHCRYACEEVPACNGGCAHTRACKMCIRHNKQGVIITSAQSMRDIRESARARDSAAGSARARTSLSVCLPPLFLASLPPSQTTCRQADMQAGMRDRRSRQHALWCTGHRTCCSQEQREC